MGASVANNISAMATPHSNVRSFAAALTNLQAPFLQQQNNRKDLGRRSSGVYVLLCQVLLRVLDHGS